MLTNKDLQIDHDKIKNTFKKMYTIDLEKVHQDTIKKLAEKKKSKQFFDKI